MRLVLTGFSLAALLFYGARPCRAQTAWLAPDTSYNSGRTALVIGGVGLAAVGLYAYLGAAWYSGNPRTNFHWHNDWSHWQQLDKLGHAYGAYQESRAMTRLLLWAGWKRRRAAVWGGAAGFLLQSPIEYFDGRMKDYGASSADLTFNALGAGLCAFNELLWREQRLQMRFSFFPTDYPNQRPGLLGENLPQQLVKDYNGQTYWLSVRLNAFLGESAAEKFWPDWLNPAVGYSGNGMIGGYGTEPAVLISRREYRRYFLSLQIDWQQIETRSRWLKTLFFALNCLHLPAPALEWRSGGLRAHPVYF